MLIDAETESGAGLESDENSLMGYRKLIEKIVPKPAVVKQPIFVKKNRSYEKYAPS